MKIRNIAIFGAIGVAAIALIGAGAAATFNQNTTSQQTITSGQMNVVVSSPGATGNGTPNITLPSVGPESSSFVTSYAVTITNDGNIPVNEIAYQLNDQNNNSDFEAQTWACLYSDGYLYFNEPLTTVEGYGQAGEADTIAVGGTDSYTLVIYAGSQDDGCGAAYTGYDPNYVYTTPDGQTITGAYTGADTYSSTPSFGTNPGAASLTNDAENGTLIPTFTASFEG